MYVDFILQLIGIDFDWRIYLDWNHAATTLDDAGHYECQLSSTPLKTHVIRLRIIGKDIFFSLV